MVSASLVEERALTLVTSLPCALSDLYLRYGAGWSLPDHVTRAWAVEQDEHRGIMRATSRFLISFGMGKLKKTWLRPLELQPS